MPVDPEAETSEPSRPRNRARGWTSSENLGTLLGGGGQVPPVVWLLAILLGSAGSGVGGSMFGGAQSAEDMARLEEKVDKLDEKMTQIRILIATHHGAHRPPDQP